MPIPSRGLHDSGGSSWLKAQAAELCSNWHQIHDAFESGTVGLLLLNVLCMEWSEVIVDINNILIAKI